MFDPRVSTEIRRGTEAVVNSCRVWQEIHASYSPANEAERSSALNLPLIRAGSWFVGTHQLRCS